MRTRQGRRVWYLAHRYVHLLLLGIIPDGHEVHHTCRETLCVSPRHLVSLTPEDHQAEQDWLRRETLGYGA